MPICFNKQEQTWELKDPTEDEKEALLNLGVNFLIDMLGEQAAQRIFDQVGLVVNKTLDAIPVEEMGKAN